MENTTGEILEVSSHYHFLSAFVTLYQRLSLKEAKSLGIDVPASALENLDCKTGI